MSDPNVNLAAPQTPATASSPSEEPARGFVPPHYVREKAKVNIYLEVTGRNAPRYIIKGAAGGKSVRQRRNTLEEAKAAVDGVFEEILAVRDNSTRDFVLAAEKEVFVSKIEWVTREELAKYYKCSVRTITNLMGETLPYVKIKNLVRFNKAECDRAMENVKVAAKFPNARLGFVKIGSTHSFTTPSRETQYRVMLAPLAVNLRLHGVGHRPEILRRGSHVEVLFHQDTPRFLQLPHGLCMTYTADLVELPQQSSETPTP
jgi:hypothetical protein